VIILQRKARGRVQLTDSDRLFFIQLYRWFPSVLNAMTIVQPETLLRWHREGFRRYWRWKSRNCGGGPPISAELRALIRSVASRAHRRPREKPGLFDYFVREGKQFVRHSKAERLGCGKVDDQLKLGWLLDWKVGGLRSLENPVNKIARVPEQIRVVWAIGHKAGRCDEVAVGMNRRQSRAKRQSIDADVIGVYQRTWTYVERLRAAPEPLESRSDVSGLPYCKNVNIESNFTGSGLNLGYLEDRRGIARIGDKGESL
jgi:hypothetical protein